MSVFFFKLFILVLPSSVHVREKKELMQSEKDEVWVLHVNCKVGMAEPTHSPASGNLTQPVASSRANVIDLFKKQINKLH